MKRATYVSFMAMRDWAKNMPSTSTRPAVRRATVRRRNSMRTSRYRQPSRSAPAMTPMIRHA